MATHNIGTIDEFPEGKGTQVKVDGTKLAVFKVDGDLYAILDSCPHKFMPFHVVGHKRYLSQYLIDNGLYEEGMYGGMEEDGSDMEIRGRLYEDELSVVCPAHQLEFDLQTGENELTDWRVPTFEVEVEDDGQVFVEL